MMTNSHRYVWSSLAALVAVGSLTFVACGGGSDVDIETGGDIDSGVQQEAGADVQATDAGKDQGAPDVVGSDAETPDAAEDTGNGQDGGDVVDAAPSDGAADVAVVDGGEADVVQVDGGEADAEPADAGPPKEKCGDDIDNDGDGLTDEDGAEGCVKIYSDGDKDGFGQYEIRCSCPPPKPAEGETTNGTDCYDGNKDAHPNSQVWALVNRGDGSFDYNCDGQETPRYTSMGKCERTVTGCKMTEGWLGTVPGCGVQGQWLVSCRVVSISECKPQKKQQKVQECR